MLAWAAFLSTTGDVCSFMVLRRNSRDKNLETADWVEGFADHVYAFKVSAYFRSSFFNF